LVDTATVIVTLLLAALFTFSASIKLLGVPKSLAIRDHLGVSPNQWRVIGALELAGVIGVLAGLLWAPIGIAAAIGSRWPWRLPSCTPSDVHALATASRVNYRALYERFAG
jgi:hypothetical protein